MEDCEPEQYELPLTAYWIFLSKCHKLSSLQGPGRPCTTRSRLSERQQAMVRTAAKWGPVWPALQGQPHLSPVLAPHPQLTQILKGDSGDRRGPIVPVDRRVWQVAS